MEDPRRIPEGPLCRPAPPVVPAPPAPKAPPGAPLAVPVAPAPPHRPGRPRGRGRVGRPLDEVPLRLLVTLALLCAIGPFAVDMYLPTFPDLASDLSTSAARVQLTLTTFMLGMAAGQLVLDPCPTGSAAVACCWPARSSRSSPGSSAPSRPRSACSSWRASCRASRGPPAWSSAAPSSPTSPTAGPPPAPSPRSASSAGGPGGRTPARRSRRGARRLARHLRRHRRRRARHGRAGVVRRPRDAAGRAPARRRGPRRRRHRPGRPVAPWLRRVRRHARPRLRDRLLLRVGLPLRAAERRGLSTGTYSLVFATNALGIAAGGAVSTKALRRFSPSQVLTTVLLQLPPAPPGCSRRSSPSAPGPRPCSSCCGSRLQLRSDLRERDGARGRRGAVRLGTGSALQARCSSRSARWSPRSSARR